MRKHTVFIAVPISLLLALCLASLALQNGYDLFQKALAKERGEGNLEEAISLYQKVVDEASDESLAAKAQLRIGICYEKLGLKKAKQAQKAFQKVIDNYPSQTDTVKVAKEKLSILMKAQTAIKRGDKEFKMRQVWEGLDLEVMGAPSPDGRYICYTDWETDDLAIYEISNGKKRRLTNNATGEGGWIEESRWSPDGKQIVYTWWRRDGTGDLRIVGLDGSKPRILFHDEKVPGVNAADWSPDGKYILASISKQEGYFISLVSVADGSTRIVKNVRASNMHFSPDGRFVLFARNMRGDQRWDLWCVPIKGGKPQKLGTPMDRISNISPHPDGRQIIFTSHGPTLKAPEIWVMENFLPEEKKGKGGQK